MGGREALLLRGFGLEQLRHALNVFGQRTELLQTEAAQQHCLAPTNDAHED